MYLMDRKEFAMLVNKFTGDKALIFTAKDTAVGFGWVRIKNGKEYVKWDRFNAYIKDIGFSSQAGKDGGTNRSPVKHNKNFPTRYGNPKVPKRYLRN